MASAEEWDLFISHASEDKSFVRPLAEALQAAGLRVWYDDFVLRVGDSLRRSIDRGLSLADHGLVVISPAFLRKEWPQKELDALVARESSGTRLILPVWHQITAQEVGAYSPLLADRLATSSERGIAEVVTEVLRALGHSSSPAVRLSRLVLHFIGDHGGGAYEDQLDNHFRSRDLGEALSILESTGLISHVFLDQIPVSRQNLFRLTPMGRERHKLKGR